MFQCGSTQLLCAALVWPIGSMKVNRKPTYPEKWSAQKGRVSWDGRSGSRLPRLNLSDRESTLTAPPSNTHVHTVLICFTAWCFINVRFLLHCPLFQFSTHCHLKLCLLSKYRSMFCPCCCWFCYCFNTQLQSFETLINTYIYRTQCGTPTLKSVSVQKQQKRTNKTQ